MANKAVLGVDYGAKRVGLAISHGSLAQPLTTLSNSEKLLDQLQIVTTDHNITQIVVGLPRNLDGNDTAQTRVVRKFADKLADYLNLPVELQDEALTSQVAEERIGKNGDKRLIDQEAAAIILQDYLDSQ